MTTTLVAHLFEAVARDFATVLRLAEERHALTNPRRAFFGVSLGVLLAAFVFLRDGIRERLLGAIGHADLPRFIRSYAPRSRRIVAALPQAVISQLTSPRTTAGLAFLRALSALTGRREPVRALNPMNYVDRAGLGRKIRFLVGDSDPLVRPVDAMACAHRFDDGACYVVPGLGHGDDGFENHVRYFLATQLGDWA
jgi:hypothetical protein